ncbi:MAG: SUMF1/EgtB/PvdO family nonheme iron enzyme [Gammaproteobacteria bacterium]
MRAAKKLTVDSKLLQELVPLNALSAERFREVSEKILIEEVLAGHYLFRKGDRDNQSIYLLEGKVNLIDGFRKVTSEVEAGTDISRYPIANQQPRSLSARAVKKVVIAKIDSSLLDVFLTWDQSNTAEVVEIGAETNKDWMTRVLQSEAFIKIPPSMIQSLLIKMESLPVKAGDTVIRQGDNGDYFYTLHEGRCVVTRQDSPGGEPQLLAELGEGDSFGEDALVSNTRRNATVSMLTDGLLMRLAKKDFVELLKNQLVKRVDYEQAAAMVDDGAVWVDVRTADEYENGAFEDSVNIPLFRLRDELSELVFNSKYIICCDTGRRSESAGFLLSHKGFDVYVLEGGIPGLSGSASEPVDGEDAADSTELLAEVVDFDGGSSVFAGQSDADGSPVGDDQDAPVGSESAPDVMANQQAAAAEALLQERYQALQEEFSGSASDYEQQIGRLQEQLAEKELDERLQQQTTLSDTLKEELDHLKHEFAEVSAQLNEKSGQVSGLEADNSALSGQLQALQRDNEILRTELRDAGVQQEEQREQLENLLADRQASEEAVQRQQSEWGVERAALQQALDGEQQVVTALREELSLALLQSSEDKSALEAELKARLDKSNERIEQLEIRQVELKQDRSRQDDELQAVMAEREQLQQQHADSEAQKQQLESGIESLKQEAESLASSSNEQLQQLQSQLQEAREKTGAVEQSNEEKDAHLSSLQEQLALHRSESEAVQQERDILQQQLSDLRLQLEKQEERAKALEEENKLSVQKAHEDLTRKNDNEKELQGQIDRLRKKVEQQTTDHQKDREGAREDVDNLREQLHAERQARAEERSEMAARQRELKEQFALIATEHETNLSNHNGAIEQARNAARQEEQERVREMLAEHVETEEQIDRLQQELKKAHEEIAALARQEKDRRKVDVDLMEEQNRQAVATISQLESQLKQYTEERDAALEEQQSLRDRMNALRGEVEVARGLMGVGEQVEDPAKLRNELNESKKNVEIALRLRAEAEAARDKLQQERDALRQQLDSGEVSSEPLHVPSLDKLEAVSGHPGPGPKARQAILPVTPVDREQDSQKRSLVDDRRENKQRRWLGAAIGLCTVTACALAGWLLFGVDVPLFDSDAGQQLPVAMQPVAEPEAIVISESPATEVQPAAASVEVEIEPVAATVQESPPAVEHVTVQTSVPDKEQLQSQANEAVDVMSLAPVVAGRSYRENLQLGGQGPLMVELPAGSYEMGSVGNSLNFDEGPRHRVNVAAFSAGKYEVTFEEYDRFARATGRRLPYDESWGRGGRPVINVSWDDARAYARWLTEQTGQTYRLPSEAEWEYFTRAGSVASFWWHDDSNNLHANCFDCGSEWDSLRTAPVGSFVANDFGLHDVTGNVQEWTSDCYHGSYHGAPVDGSSWQFPECVMRVVRGGAYTSPLDSLRSAKRSQYDQDTRLDNLGFRVVREH